MNDNSPNLRSLVREISSEGYFEWARNRAQRRKSPWNLLLIPAFFGGAACVFIVLFQAMWRVHVAFYPEHAGRLREFWRAGISPAAFVSSFLLAMPLLVAAMPIGMMLANCVVWCVGPARRALDEEARGVKWASFRDSMSGLGWISLVAGVIGLLLSLIGAMTLKSLR